MRRKPKEDIDDPRRKMLVRALAGGFFVAGGSAGILQPVHAMGKIPKILESGKSIYDMRGNVTVSGRKADENTLITSSDVVVTGRRSHVVFAVGKDAFVLRSNSRLELSGSGMLVNTLRLVTGKLLSVFGKTKHRIKTPNATIGIRGTGVYTEAEPEQTYICTCYGVVDLSADNDKDSTETIVSQHHDAPRYILSNEASGRNIREAPFINHTDLELQVIEGLVGREPPFTMAGGGYSAPRRTDY
ncbi:MAG: hypothetical protein COA54_04630 [Thiotrichaceae bacterium]|nr:MAG: hypothetical protein COA54_04630 [Thiotrichaceae bacterium]